MYRVAPGLKTTFADSGWVFLSGMESLAYLDEPRNLAIYDVNKIANYDPDIIRLLDAPSDRLLPVILARDDSSRLHPRLQNSFHAGIDAALRFPAQTEHNRAAQNRPALGRLCQL